MIDKAQFTQYSGEGTFASGDLRIKMSFTVYLQFSHIGLEAEGDDHKNMLYLQFGKSKLWSLSGQLEDGRPINADQLLHTGWGEEGHAEFSPLAEIAIGESDPSPPIEARYPLIGMFEGEFSIAHSGWTIMVVSSADKTDHAGRLSKSWGVPLEGLTLKITERGATIDEYHEKAREIMLLMSLSRGNGVTSFRQIVNWGDRGSMETWRRMTGHELGPGPVIPAFMMGKFLEQVLPIWEEWVPDTRSLTRQAISYINLSGKGYLDTRLFQIAQAWEFLATAWIPKGKLNALESDLRKRIKCIYREWKKEHTEADPNGIWGTRILSPFQRPVAKRQMESLATNVGIDLAAIGLDLVRLKEARDSVAHTGRMTDSLKTDRPYLLLKAAQFGLQLLLLTKLGYSDLVVTDKNGWESYEPIATFLKHVE